VGLSLVLEVQGARVLDARVSTPGGDHRDPDGQALSEQSVVADGPIVIVRDMRLVEGGPMKAERVEKMATQVTVEGDTARSLQDVSRQVDAEIGVLVVVADREPQPGMADALAVGVERSGAYEVVRADRGLVGEPCGVAEQVAQRDRALGMGLESALDAELGEIVRDRLVETDQAISDREQHRGRRVHL
jgi:hypothetical protein